MSFITVRQGHLPIIISAPHGGDRLLPGIAVREDRGQRFFATVRDQQTAELADLLARALAKRLAKQPFAVIARFDRRHIDANRAPADAYTPQGDGGPKLVYDAYHKALVDAVMEVTRRWGRGLLIDLHGQSRFPDQIIRGTSNGRTVASLVRQHGEAAIAGPQSIFGALSSKGYPISPTGESDDVRERFFTGGFIIDHHGSAAGGAVDAIQIEVGSRYRAKQALPTTAADLAHAISTFATAYLPKP